MFKKTENIKPDDRSVRSESDAESQRGSVDGQLNIVNDLLNISNEDNNASHIKGMRENESYGNGNNNLISNEDNNILLKSLDRMPKEEKGGLIESLDQIIAENDRLPGEYPDPWAEDKQSVAANKGKDKIRKKTEKKPQKNKIEPTLEDLNVMSEDSKPIAGWNFVAQALPERHKPTKKISSSAN